MAFPLCYLRLYPTVAKARANLNALMRRLVGRQADAAARTIRLYMGEKNLRDAARHQVL